MSTSHPGFKKLDVPGKNELRPAPAHVRSNTPKKLEHVKPVTMVHDFGGSWASRAKPKKGD